MKDQFKFWVFLFFIAILPVALTMFCGIYTWIYWIQHPELTQMQITLFQIKKFWFIDVYVLVDIFYIKFIRHL